MGVLVGSGVAVVTSEGVAVSAGGSGGLGVGQLYSKQQPWQAKPSWEIPSAEQETNLPMEKDQPEQGLGSQEEQVQSVLGLAKARKVQMVPGNEMTATKTTASSKGRKKNFRYLRIGCPEKRSTGNGKRHCLER